MKVTFDKETYFLYIEFKAGQIVESNQDKSGEMIIDYAQNGSIVGIEVLNASGKLSMLTKSESVIEI